MAASSYKSTLEIINAYNAGQLTKEQATQEIANLLSGGAPVTYDIADQAVQVFNQLTGGGGGGGGTSFVKGQTRLETEAQEGGLGQSFRQYLASLPGYGGLSAMGQRALGRQYDPALLSFQLGGPQFQDQPQSFREWLTSGQVLSPTGIQSRLGEISGYATPAPGLTEAARSQQTSLREMYRDNPTAFNAYLEAATGGVHPLFRGAVGRAAQQRYEGFQDEGPERSFLDYMARRGGFFGTKMPLSGGRSW